MGYSESIENLIIDIASRYPDDVYIEYDDYENKLNLVKKNHKVSPLDLRLRIVKREQREASNRNPSKEEDSKSTSESQSINAPITTEAEQD